MRASGIKQSQTGNNVSICAVALSSVVLLFVGATLLFGMFDGFEAEVASRGAVIFPAVFYLGFAFFALLLALSRPHFSELWMFASFCGSMFLWIWYSANEQSRINAVFSVDIFARGILAVSSVGLSLAFFRLSHRTVLIVLSAASLALMAIFLVSPVSLAAKNSALVVLLFFLHAGVFVVGFVLLVRKRAEFRLQGLQAFEPSMRRRFVSASIFVAVMLVWFVGAFVNYQNLSMPSSLFRTLLWIAPTFAMFLQFYWSITTSQRFREKLAPKLDYIDYLVLEMGDAASERTYTGVLASFDLKGFKRVTGLKSRSPAFRDAVNNLLNGLRAQIEELVTPNKTVFRFKSNGDEWVWVLYAKDGAAAHQILEEIVLKWHEKSRQILETEKQRFASSVESELDLAASMVIDFVDLHVMFCVLSKITIASGTGTSLPEFYADGFTNLSETFKTSTHNAVAMFREEAEAICDKLKLNAKFERSNSAYCDAGFLTWKENEEENL